MLIGGWIVGYMGSQSQPTKLLTLASFTMVRARTDLSHRTANLAEPRTKTDCFIRTITRPRIHAPIYPPHTDEFQQTTSGIVVCADYDSPASHYDADNDDDVDNDDDDDINGTDDNDDNGDMTQAAPKLFAHVLQILMLSAR